MEMIGLQDPESHTHLALHTNEVIRLTMLANGMNSFYYTITIIIQLLKSCLHLCVSKRKTSCTVWIVNLIILTLVP